MTDSGTPESLTDKAQNLPASGAMVRALFIGLCFLVLAAPLPLGAARPLAWDAMGLGVAILLIASLALTSLDLGEFRKDLTIPIALFAVVLLWAAIQVSAETPAAWHNPLWDQAQESLGVNVRGSIAIDKDAALIHLFRLLSYGGIFYLTLIFCRDSLRARAALKFLTLASSCYAAYGLIVYWSGNTTILWFPKWTYLEDLTGPFVNRNSFATYLGLGILTAFCQVMTVFEELRYSQEWFYADWRTKLIKGIEFASGHALLLLGLFALVIALFLTHSRGGFLSIVGGMIGLTVAMGFAPSLGRMRRVGWVSIPFIIILMALLISGGMTFDRLAEIDTDAAGRLMIYRVTSQAIGDYPLLGIGLGSFASIFPIYITEAFPFYYDMAHNDYLQNMLELGIPAAIALFSVLLWMAALCIRGLRIRQRDALYPALGIAASVLVGLESMIDFSLQIPAVTATYVFLLGIGVAQSRSSRMNAATNPSGFGKRFSRKPDSEPDRISTRV